MEITKEQFDQAIASLATKEDVKNARDEVILAITDMMANIEEGLGPEERLVLIERKLDRLQDHLHIEV
jgi:hypothetical protein